MKYIKDYFRLTKKNFFKGLLIYPAVFISLYFAKDIAPLGIPQKDTIAFIYFLIAMTIFPIINIIFDDPNNNEYEDYKEYGIKNFKQRCDLVKNFLKSLFTYPMILFSLYFAYYFIPIGIFHKNLIALACLMLTLIVIFPIINFSVNNFIKLCKILNNLNNDTCA